MRVLARFRLAGHLQFGFVAACGYFSEILDLCQVVLDPMSPLAGFESKGALPLQVVTQQDDGRCAARVQFCQKPSRVEDFVGK